MKITATYEDLREFVSFYHLFQYGNSAVFDRIAFLVEKGIDSEELARLFWVSSNCDRCDVEQIHNKVCAWFDANSPANVSRSAHPSLVKRIVEIARFRRDVFVDEVSVRNVVLAESFERAGELVSVSFSVEGKGYQIDFADGFVGRNESYDTVKEV